MHLGCGARNMGYDLGPLAVTRKMCTAPRTASEALVTLVILVLFVVAESDDRYKRLQVLPRFVRSVCCAA